MQFKSWAPDYLWSRFGAEYNMNGFTYGGKYRMVAKHLAGIKTINPDQKHEVISNAAWGAVITGLAMWAMIDIGDDDENDFWSKQVKGVKIGNKSGKELFKSVMQQVMVLGEDNMAYNLSKVFPAFAWMASFFSLISKSVSYGLNSAGLDWADGWKRQKKSKYGPKESSKIPEEALRTFPASRMTLQYLEENTPKASKYKKTDRGRGRSTDRNRDRGR
jgi:hypothetical protein